MSIKYNSMADIPEDLIKLAGKCKHGLPYNQLTLGGHRSSIDLNDMERNIGANPIRTNEEVEAAKECLARCESEAVNDWLGTIDGLPPVDKLCEMAFSEEEIWRPGRVKFYGRRCFVWEGFSGNECWLDTSSVLFRPLKTEAELAEEKAAEDLQCEIDMINAYLEQMNNTLSYYDVEMIAKYIINREG